MSSFDRWFRCKISTRQREQIEREEQESGGGGRRRPQQIIQLAAAAGGTLPRTVVNTPTGASLAIQRGPVEVSEAWKCIVGVKGTSYTVFAVFEFRAANQRLPSHRGDYQ